MVCFSALQYGMVQTRFIKMISFIWLDTPNISRDVIIKWKWDDYISMEQ